MAKRAHKHTVTATIATGSTSLSPAVSLLGGLPVGLVVDSTWTSSNITFRANVPDSTTFHDVYTSTGGAVTLTGVTADSYITLDPATFSGFDQVQLVCVSTQAAARTMQLVVLARSDQTNAAS